jgi:hypothetical protein
MKFNLKTEQAGPLELRENIKPHKQTADSTNILKCSFTVDYLTTLTVTQTRNRVLGGVEWNGMD